MDEKTRSLAVKDDRENYKTAQNTALSIEATLWHALNKSKIRVEEAYALKNRHLLNYIMDDHNYELRLQILIGEKKPDYLCHASEKV